MARLNILRYPDPRLHTVARAVTEVDERIRRLVDDIVLVSDDDIERAVAMLISVEKTVAEGAGAAGLAACGSGEAVGAAASSAASAAASAAASVAGDAIAAASVPVGGGVILDRLKVVVTQPTAGDFKAFSAVCPHQGCTVNAVEGGQITCPCHGSAFDIATGAVTKGPATSGLPTKGVTVGADGITVS